ncbi:MAG: RHS repeat-associated core domain-containing protein [Acidobacteriota bacterium]
MTTDLTGRSFAYDAENRPVSYNGGSVTVNASYDYDGEGRRVRRVQNGVTTVFVSNGQGQLAAEYSSQAAAGPGGTSYVMADHLGSTRLVTNADGTVRGRHDYLPFGEEIGTSYGGRSAIAGYGAIDLRHKFTAKERDSESLLDYFGARYFSGAQGRFTSVDPIQADLLRVISPQRWNLYNYAVNNPLQFVDPDGRDAVAVNFSQEASGLGHAALVSVDRNGYARYGDFRPKTPHRAVNPEKLTLQELGTKIQFAQNGLPTEASLEALAQEIASLQKVPLETVSLAYFKTSDLETAALNAFFDDLERRSRETSGLYVLGIRDCIGLCMAGLEAAGIGGGPRNFVIPNLFQLLILQRADAAYSGRKPTEQVEVKLKFPKDKPKKKPRTSNLDDSDD